MPIHGLSERRQMTRLGKIRLGKWVEPGGGKKGHPESTPYFVCPPEVQEALRDEQPKSLEILFPVDDPALLFPQWLKAYKGRGGRGSRGMKWCWGDGQTAQRRGEDGRWNPRACPCELLESGDCQAVATLHFFLPQVPGLGIWVMDTRGKTSIVGLNSDLDMYRSLFGGLRGIPFTLRLEPTDTEYWDKEAQKMKPTTIQVVRLGTGRSLQEIVEWRKSLGKSVDLMLPVVDDEEDDADVPPALTAGATPALSAGTHDEPFDITRAFKEAARLGIDDKVYTDYLFGVYRKDTDNIGLDHLAEQADRFRRAASSKDEAAQFIAAIENVAGKVREGKVAKR